MFETAAPILLRAACFAARCHRDQRRKDAAASPYINHPLEVAALLAEEGGLSDPDLLTAALLHDTVEDSPATFADIESKFGSAVRALVAEVTDDPALSEPQRKRRQVEHAPQLSRRAKQLKLADKISNLRDLDADHPIGWDRQRKLDYIQWGRDVAAGCHGVCPPLESLLQRVADEAEQRVSAS